MLRCRFEDLWGQHVRVHFEPDLERHRRIHVLLDDLVQAERVGPELLVTKGVEAEDTLALGEEGGGGLLCRLTIRLRSWLRSLGNRLRRSASAEYCSRCQRDEDQRCTTMTLWSTRPTYSMLFLDYHVVLFRKPNTLSVNWTEFDEFHVRLAPIPETTSEMIRQRCVRVRPRTRCYLIFSRIWRRTRHRRTRTATGVQPPCRAISALV